MYFWQKYHFAFLCVSDFVQLYQLLDNLQGNVDERCNCIQTVLREADRFKRAALVQKLSELVRSVRHSASAFRPVGSAAGRSPSVDGPNSFGAALRTFRQGIGRESSSSRGFDDG